MRLCLAVGELDPDRLLASITYRQLLEWMALYGIEPWGDERADMRSAMQAMVTANSAPFGGKREPFKTGDFMLDFEKDDKPKPADDKPKREGKSWQEMLNTAKRITRRFGGKVPD